MMTQRFLTNLSEMFLEFALGRLGRFGPPRRELLMGLTRFLNPALNTLAKYLSAPVGGLAFDCSQWLFDFFGSNLNMRKAGLAILGRNTVIGGESVGDQDTVEFFAEQLLRSLGGTMGIPPKDR